jgi:hypothetical protein
MFDDGVKATASGETVQVADICMHVRVGLENADARRAGELPIATE